MKPTQKSTIMLQKINAYAHILSHSFHQMTSLVSSKYTTLQPLLILLSLLLPTILPLVSLSPIIWSVWSKPINYFLWNIETPNLSSTWIGVSYVQAIEKRIIRVVFILLAFFNIPLAEVFAFDNFSAHIISSKLTSPPEAMSLQIASSLNLYWVESIRKTHLMYLFSLCMLHYLHLDRGLVACGFSNLLT